MQDNGSLNLVISDMAGRLDTVKEVVEFIEHRLDSGTSRDVIVLSSDSLGVVFTLNSVFIIADKVCDHTPNQLSLLI